MPHALKIRTQVFWIMALGKRQNDSPLLGLCYGLISHLGFYVYRSPPSNKLLMGLHSTFAMLIKTARCHQFQQRSNSFHTNSLPLSLPDRQVLISETRTLKVTNKKLVFSEYQEGETMGAI
jgi:hypothetical protein